MKPADPRDGSQLQVSDGHCEWCKGPLPKGSRRDRKTCSKRCRQAKARFKIRRAHQVATDRPMRFAYADPPYPKLARRYYGDHRDFDGEVDHAELVERLVRDYPDGWALSTSAASTRDVWALCPAGTRLCIWVNGPRKVKSYGPLHAYESLFVFGGRERREPVVEDLCDVLSWGGRQHSHPGALPGMKPAAFCEWLFQLLGATVGDQLDDLFPGSGAVARAWSLYTGDAGQLLVDAFASSGSASDASIAGDDDTPSPSPCDACGGPVDAAGRCDVCGQLQPASSGDVSARSTHDPSRLTRAHASVPAIRDGDRPATSTATSSEGPGDVSRATTVRRDGS